MSLLGLDKKILKLVLETVDKTIGKKFPMIDKLTDLFQDQKILEQKIKELELKLNALEQYVKEDK